MVVCGKRAIVTPIRVYRVPKLVACRHAYPAVFEKELQRTSILPTVYGNPKRRRKTLSLSLSLAFSFPFLSEQYMSLFQYRGICLYLVLNLVLYLCLQSPPVTAGGGGGGIFIPSPSSAQTPPTLCTTNTSTRCTLLG